MDDGSNYGHGDFGQGGLNSMLNVKQLLDEIGLTSSEIQWRKDFIDFDSEDAKRLASYQDSFATHAEQVADDFYENLTKYEETVEVIGRSPKGINQLKQTQSAYLVTLADGEYGEEYFRNRARIGKLHDLLDMPMKQYIGQYGVYYDLIAPIVADRYKQSLIERLISTSGTDKDDQIKGIVHEEIDEAFSDMLSILRIINLDMQIVSDTYIHSYSKDLKNELDRQQSVVQEVENAVESSQQTASDIATRSERISELSQNQADSMQSVSSEIAGLSSTVEEIAATAEEVATTSETAKQRARKGKKAASDAIEAIEAIADAAEQMSEDIERLTEQIDEITDIVEVIDNIADQTNLLALNASVEAARADSSGDGFGVVAGEIKSLAEESQQRATEIDQMVKDITENADRTRSSLDTMTAEVTRGTEQVEAAATTFQEISNSVTETAEGIQEVSDATDEQAASTEEIAANINELVTQSDTIAEEITEIAEANDEQAEKINSIYETVHELTAEGNKTKDSPSENMVETPDDHPPIEEL